jgi:hypothetical protein
VDVKPGAKLEAGRRPSDTIEQFCLSPDGKTFYVPKAIEEGGKPITVVLNWWA